MKDKYLLNPVLRNRAAPTHVQPYYRYTPYDLNFA